MTLTLHLSPELESRLQEEALRQGVSIDAVTVRLLEQTLPPADRRAEAIALLQSWIDSDDSQEQRETGDFLIQALDEDRPGNRPLFPPELKGISW